MTVSETPTIYGSTVHAPVADTTDVVTIDAKTQCDSRSEETTPRTPPEPDPQHMDEKLADGGLKDGEPAPPELTQQRAATDTPSEADPAAETVS